MTQKEIIKKIEKINRICKKFKIGKTGQTKEDRFASEYSSEYDFIEVLTFSKYSKIITYLEKVMIKMFRNRKKCQNDQIGGGKMEKSKRYILYIVYK